MCCVPLARLIHVHVHPVYTISQKQILTNVQCSILKSHGLHAHVGVHVHMYIVHVVHVRVHVYTLYIYVRCTKPTHLHHHWVYQGHRKCQMTSGKTRRHKCHLP